jgi:Molybdate transporter of MFS superfamily
LLTFRDEQQFAGMEESMAEETIAAPLSRRFDRMEFAGAFGDLGTLVPFIVAYVGVLKMDPFGVLLALWPLDDPLRLLLSHLDAGPAHEGSRSYRHNPSRPDARYYAGHGVGCQPCDRGHLACARSDRNGSPRSNSRPVVTGIILGLGYWGVGGAALLATSLLLTNRIFPAMFLLLLFGAGYGILSDPSLLSALRDVHVEFRIPEFALSALTLNDFLLGTAFLALPQLPLTLGNAVIATTEENNHLFPNHPVNEDKIAISTGLMNLLSSSVGGVPMCHGAGGMAGHVQFGARTGGALVILGMVLLVTAVMFSGSVGTLMRLFPPAVLGVILFLTGAQLALGGSDLGNDKGERFVTLITGALAVWNVGIACVVGVVAYRLVRRNLLRL